MDEDQKECGRPCPPNDCCEECETYWQRMRHEGFWKDSKGWTERGMAEIRRHA